MARKINQISISARSDSGVFLAVAVADDGTAWKIRLDVSDSDVQTEWIPLPALPGTVPPETPQRHA